MRRSGSGSRSSTPSLTFAGTRLPQIPFLPAEASKRAPLDPEAYKLPTDLHPLILEIEEFGSDIKHKILSFPQAVPAAMADSVDEQVSIMNEMYRSVRRRGEVSVREGVMAIGGIIEEICEIDEEVDERIIAWGRREREDGGEAAGVAGEGGSKGLGGRVMRNLKELGRAENRREKVREIWESTRGTGWKEAGGGKKVPVRAGEETEGKVEEDDEPEGSVRVMIDETPSSDDGDPAPGFKPIMEWERGIFRDDSTHV